MTDERPLSQEYAGIIWIGGRPGIRFAVLATCSGDAKDFLAEVFGDGHGKDMWNERAASRPRE